MSVGEILHEHLSEPIDQPCVEIAGVRADDSVLCLAIIVVVDIDAVYDLSRVGESGAGVQRKVHGPMRVVTVTGHSDTRQILTAVDRIRDVGRIAQSPRVEPGVGIEHTALVAESDVCTLGRDRVGCLHVGQGTGNQQVWHGQGFAVGNSELQVPGGLIEPWRVRAVDAAGHVGG